MLFGPLLVLVVVYAPGGLIGVCERLAGRKHGISQNG
jgi:ABC-type branched-subunit amino acid transport system permease subunit